MDQKQKPRAVWFRRAAAATAVIALALALLIAADGRLQPPSGIAFAENTATPEMLDSPFKAVYAAISPSVVGIQVTSRVGFFGRIATSTDFVGSGVVLGDGGYVVTNYHVVEGAEGVYVVSGENAFPAEYIAGDRETDVAVLRVADERLPAPAAAGDSDALSVGDWALVIGNPLGEQFQSTLTVGVISGLGRDLTENGKSGGATNMIQTNAAINAGNSGGGLFNIRGELIGITSMKLSNNGYYGYASIEGIGLAIPVNAIKTIVNDLIQFGRVRYPRVGINTVDINSPSMTPTQELLPRSALVTEVEKNGPADRGGVRADDLILSVDGVRVTSGSEVQSAVRKHQPGEAITFVVYRIPGLSSVKVDEPIPDGETLTLTVVAALDES